jgi:hypothetical protein
MGEDRKKSWRDVDRARGTSSHRRDELERNRERASKTQAYSAYKANLDRLFQPGGAELPASMREQLGPTDEGAQARRQRLAALTKDPSLDTLRAVVEAGDPLPREPRLMMRLLDVRDEDLLRTVAVHLGALIDDGVKVHAPLLMQRLTAARTWIEEDESEAALSALEDRV